MKTLWDKFPEPGKIHFLERFIMLLQIPKLLHYFELYFFKIYSLCWKVNVVIAVNVWKYGSRCGGRKERRHQEDNNCSVSTHLKLFFFNENKKHLISMWPWWGRLWPSLWTLKKLYCQQIYSSTSLSSFPSRKALGTFMQNFTVFIL